MGARGSGTGQGRNSAVGHLRAAAHLPPLVEGIGVQPFRPRADAVDVADTTSSNIDFAAPAISCSAKALAREVGCVKRVHVHEKEQAHAHARKKQSHILANGARANDEHALRFYRILRSGVSVVAC